MNKLTIQINNLEALERLIGGDNQIELEIRNSVVQKFAEKHLKPLANSDHIKKILSQVRDDITKQISEKCDKEIATFKSTWSGISDIKLHPSIKTEIDRHVRTLVDGKIRDAVEESTKFWATDKEINAVVSKRFEYYTSDLINEQIRSRIEKLKKQL